MQLWLVRHAVAAEQGEFDGPDAERPLTAKGRRRFREFCDWLADQTTLPKTILSSPLIRAAQTAAILAKFSGLKKTDVISTDLLSPGVDVEQLVQFVRSQTAECVALVGHEPDMSRILAEFVDGGAFRFGKGFVAAVEFDSAPEIGAGRLCWFVGPKLPGPDLPGT
jgi:phosphohistidine phosphatase